MSLCRHTARARWSALVAFLICLPAGAARAVDPVVSNVAFAQRTDGSRLVDVTYDLADADGDACAITLQASDDGGATWIMPCTRTWGDAGPAVAPGPGKALVWDFGYDNSGWEGKDYRVRVIASDAGVLHPQHSPANYAINDWITDDFSAPSALEKYARAEIVVLTAHYLWGNAENEALRVLDGIRAVNPSCKIVGYVSAKNTALAWETPSERYPMTHLWWERTLPYWSYTTAGDTLQDWYGKVTLNILQPGCRDAIVSTIVDMQRASNNKFDGVFWDYFNPALWIAPGVTFEGEPDLDGDGISHWVDPNEIAAWRAAQVSLVCALQDSLGPDFLQIFNGQRAYADSAFAALGDGMFFEAFPELFFPRPYTMASAMSPSYSNNLFRLREWPRKTNGGPYQIYASTQLNYYYDYLGLLQIINLGNQFRIVALLTDGYTAWCPGGNWNYGWTNVDASLGPPLGPTVIEGINYSRDFKYGRVEMIMDVGYHPDPFDYTIFVNGRTVERFARPYHFP